MDKDTFCIIMEKYSKQNRKFNSFFDKVNIFLKKDIVKECKECNFSKVAVDTMSAALNDSKGILQYFCNSCNCNFDFFNDSDIIIDGEVAEIYSYGNLYDLICSSAK